MIIGIMQPYFFPYIGYWQLLNVVDKFVIYDDVNFIKQGYINRNSILAGSSAQRITLQVLGASSNKLINEVEVGNNTRKLLTGIEQSYKKSPEFEKVFPLLVTILQCDEKNIAKFLGNSIKLIAKYLNVETEIIYSSDIDKDNTLKSENKVLEICNRLCATEYINAIGGRELYKKETFKNDGILLNFLETTIIEYEQYQNEFVPYLSIIDILMFNSPEKIQKMLCNYKFV